METFTTYRPDYINLLKGMYISGYYSKRGRECSDMQENMSGSLLSRRSCSLTRNIGLLSLV